MWLLYLKKRIDKVIKFFDLSQTSVIGIKGHKYLCAWQNTGSVVYCTVLMALESNND
jgi:hypothetical protein